MTEFEVTRAHLKGAFDQENWDLLDKLLEIDSTRINDNDLFTDTWGTAFFFAEVKCRVIVWPLRARRT